ncbi:unnamed protein product [marine sediment metagenome]|uniref:Helix-turn-helix domain-containing protein n=1 Tax=marine sediment metagenome TaxID=412755 RepID=X0S5U8_9ZZZZ
MTKDSYTGQEAADIFGVHPNTIYNWIRDGAIEAVKSGRAYTIPAAEVERIRREQTRELRRAREQGIAAGALREFYRAEYTASVKAFEPVVGGLAAWYDELAEREKEGRDVNLPAFLTRHRELMRRLLKESDRFRRVIAIDPFVKHLEAASAESLADADRTWELDYEGERHEIE